MNWLAWLIVIVVGALVAWACWEVRHAIPMPPDTYEDDEEHNVKPQGGAVA